jgi:hypothetical protein
MWIRKLLLVALLVAAPASQARADVGIGAFIGEPTGLDLKLGLSHRSALDILFGFYSHWNDRDGIDDGGYAHITYLVTPVVSSGGSIIVPLRIGIGGAVFDDRGRFDNDLNVAVRFPLEVALVFRNSPIEIYGEVALKMTLIDEDNNHEFLDLDGGIGLRFYF